MKVWTDKAGNKLTAAEFMQRWKEGIRNISPYHIIRQQYIGQWMVVIGIGLGIFVTVVAKIWWLVLLLVGSLFVSGYGLIGMYQKYKALKIIEEQSKPDE